ncbi:DEAD/DEAH box helicase [Helicovermis profundi]|uniref:DEAD/DEAH box helicase n=1 Tax=Helicovermis profundi TaxID=3065157 RepID=A0AAU9E2F8_9FIRM|nr:DEAD/DEAH box helicase [Clostridia bacterium S502]
MNKFEKYNLDKSLTKALLLMDYIEPTEVQAQSIPVIKDHKDLLIKSETGSGKTAAFAIPIIDEVMWEENAPQVLVLTPTRELAQQVSEEMFNIGRFKRMKVVSVFGKSPIKSQIKDLKQKTHIVVGTPGRIFDHIKRGTLDLSKIKYLVLDEADEMLNMGFVDQIEEILSKIPKGFIMTLLSATLPDDLSKICNRYMNSPVIVEIEKTTTQKRIEQIRYDVPKKTKMDVLLDITVIENPDTCIIFCNTRLQVDEIFTSMKKAGYPCEKLHGGMEQDIRTKVMQNFRKRYFRYLIATDVAARGIDIDDISLIINYDLPEEPQVYVHRIGRTGRKEKQGKAISLVAGDSYLLKGITELTNNELTKRFVPDKNLVESMRESFIEKINKKQEIRHEKHKELHQEIMKIHINVGKKTKMRAGDIVGALCNIEGMTKDDIGNISIIDVSTFVEILNNKGEMVLRKLQDTPIKGRLRKVNRANE